MNNKKLIISGLIKENWMSFAVMFIVGVTAILSLCLLIPGTMENILGFPTMNTMVEEMTKEGNKENPINQFGILYNSITKNIVIVVSFIAGLAAFLLGLLTMELFVLVKKPAEITNLIQDTREELKKEITDHYKLIFDNPFSHEILKVDYLLKSDGNKVKTFTIDNNRFIPDAEHTRSESSSSRFVLALTQLTFDYFKYTSWFDDEREYIEDHKSHVCERVVIIDHTICQLISLANFQLAKDLSEDSCKLLKYIDLVTLKLKAINSNDVKSTNELMTELSDLLEKYQNNALVEPGFDFSELEAMRIAKFFYDHRKSGWWILPKDKLIGSDIRLFRNFSIFTLGDTFAKPNEEKKAYFTFIDKNHHAQFTKGGWSQYWTTDKEYIEHLEADFAELKSRSEPIKNWLSRKGVSA